MPPQPFTLPRFSQIAAVPGAINLSAAQLDYDDIVRIDNAGGQSAQTTLAQLATFLFTAGPFALAARVVATLAEQAIIDTDVGLLINKTIPSDTSITLPTPVFQRVLFIKDMAGNAGTHNITLDAGSGKLINGQQTLVMDGNYGVTLLIAMSDTQWGTLI